MPASARLFKTAKLIEYPAKGVTRLEAQLRAPACQTSFYRSMGSTNNLHDGMPNRALRKRLRQA
jgi:hypothetical protein